MSTPGTETDESAYDQLLERGRKLTNLQYAQMYLNWDQQVMMPEGGAPGRAQQLSTLSAVSHDLLVDDDVAAWLDALAEADLDDEQAANGAAGTSARPTCPGS
jgi:carboxypeptidase Taq